MRPLVLWLAATATGHAVELVHHGRLLDADGVPVEGGHDLTVSLYAGAAGAHWSDTFADVPVHDGYFAVILGSGVPLDAQDLSGAGLAIGTAVDGAPELSRLDLHPDALGTDGVGIVLDDGTSPAHRRYADGTYAAACHAYLDPVGVYRYDGETGDGVYRVDPDGPGANVQPFDVYCDMTTFGGGWTLVDQDASTTAKITSPRATGAHTSLTTTGGRYLPGYAWSGDPQLLCRASAKTNASSKDWVVLSAEGPYALEYPTQTTATTVYAGQWKIVRQNGNADNGTQSWTYASGGNFGTLWIGGGSNATCACGYSGVGALGVGTYTNDGLTGTCSSWVR